MGERGAIVVEGVVGDGLELALVPGMRLEKGSISPFFITDVDLVETVLNDPYVLVSLDELALVEPLLPILQEVQATGRPLLLVAKEVDGEALATLVANRRLDRLASVAVKGPGFGDRRKAILEDVAVLTGGAVFSAELGYGVERATLDLLGSARRVVVTRDETAILEGGGDRAGVEDRISRLRAEIEASDSEWDRGKLEDRLAALTGSVAMIRIGAASEAELVERRRQVHLAISAAREGAAGPESDAQRLSRILAKNMSSLEAGRTYTAGSETGGPMDAALRVATARAGDADLGEVVVDAVDKVGWDGALTIERSLRFGTELTLVSGMRFGEGALSGAFLTEREGTEAVLEEPLVMLADQAISRVGDLLPALEGAVHEGKPVLVVAADVEGEALELLIRNTASGTVRAAAVRRPGSGDGGSAVLEDLAALTGGSVLSDAAGRPPGGATPELLGRARRVVITGEETAIVDALGDPGAIRARILRVKAEVEASEEGPARQELQQRLARLAGGVAVIGIGALTDAEFEEKRRRVEAAIAGVQELAVGAAGGGGR
ncbi:MAG: hypothetical protein HY658_05570 [Actinobacteria bacterium]|nr:hypothetical protein [Actinomycetota bacterium]